MMLTTDQLETYRRDGYLSRALRNIACQSLWRLGAPDALVRRLYG